MPRWGVQRALDLDIGQRVAGAEEASGRLRRRARRVALRERWNIAFAGEAPADVADGSAGELPDPDSLELLLSVAYQASLLREEERPVTSA